jgi:hypothetical protein
MRRLYKNVYLYGRWILSPTLLKGMGGKGMGGARLKRAPAKAGGFAAA